MPLKTFPILNCLTVSDGTDGVGGDVQAWREGIAGALWLLLHHVGRDRAICGANIRRNSRGCYAAARDRAAPPVAAGG